MEKIIKKAEQLGAEYCEVRKVKFTEWGVVLRDKAVESISGGVDEGIGIRVLHDGAWGFSTSNGMESWKACLEDSIKFAKISSKATDRKVVLADGRFASGRYEIPQKINFTSVDIDSKIDLINSFYLSASENPAVKSVEANYKEWIQETEFISSAGHGFSSVVPRASMQGILSGRDGDRSMMYRVRYGGTGGFEIIREKDFSEEGKSCANKLENILKGQRGPSGRFDVIADTDLAGVFIHEAVGHAAEGDIVTSGSSVLEKHMNKKIGNENVTVYDDPTIPGAFGSYPVDDEGIITEKRVLIENGVLTNFLVDRDTATSLGIRPCGSARGESYSSFPLVRMSNTMIKGGDWKFEEMIEDIKFGIYAKGSRGGQVETSKGSFQFNSQEAYLIENGEITTPVFDFSLGGTIMDILNRIDRVGNDEKVGSPGYCGKGQMVPVGDGGPHILIRDCMAGG